MTTPVFDYLVLAVLALAVAELLILFWMVAENRRIRRIAKFELIRGEFGSARNKLIWLARSEHIRANSQTFAVLYSIQSTMMREFSSYHVLSGVMWSHVLDGRGAADQQLQQESEKWNDETRQIANQTADALRRVWLGCMPFGIGVRVTMHLSGHLAQAIVKTLAGLLPTALREIRDTEKLLRMRAA